MTDRRNHSPQILSPAPSPEEAAAIVAAVERFARDTALERPAPARRRPRWEGAALLEAIDREPQAQALPGVLGPEP